MAMYMAAKVFDKSLWCTIGPAMKTPNDPP